MYHDEHELNALIDKFWLFSKNICRIVIIRLVLKNGRSELSLRCFPIEFVPFLKILWYFEKNRYFEGMAKLQYTGSQTSTPLTKSKYSTRLTFRWKYFLLCVGWPSNFLPWIAWNPEMSIGILKKFLQRLDTFLGHFEVILFKSQKAFLTRLILQSWSTWWRLKKAFCDLNKSLQSGARKYLDAVETFWAYLSTSLEENIFKEK